MPGEIPETNADFSIGLIPERSVQLPRLKDVLKPLETEARVDFSTLYTTHDRVFSPDLASFGEEAKTELQPFFREGVSGRSYYVYLDKDQNPDKPEAERNDFLIVREKTAEGKTVLAVFEYPGKEKTDEATGAKSGGNYWRNIEIPGIGKKDKMKFKFLNLRFAGYVSEDEQKPLDLGEDRVAVMVNNIAPLYKNPKNIKFGLLSGDQDDPEAAQMDAAVNEAAKTFLGKDTEIKAAATAVHKKGVEKRPYGNFWDFLTYHSVLAEGNLRGLASALTAEDWAGLRSGEPTEATQVFVISFAQRVREITGINLFDNAGRAVDALTAGMTHSQVELQAKSATDEAERSGGEIMDRLLGMAAVMAA